ncbi:MAG: DUF523 domain-containing protein [Coriobacteriia bacterium]|nr:DUF523 domain-containing protein [Coriobacteriia bacterium]
MKIAVSACLLGVPCRYDGRSRADDDLACLLEGHEVVRICPEVMGGLSIPHPANELVRVASEDPASACPGLPSGFRVRDVEGRDNTDAFVRGACAATDRALAAGCTHAILKAKSPSCGTGRVYDGSFTGKLVSGFGVAARMLKEQGIEVMDEKLAKNFLQSK